MNRIEIRKWLNRKGHNTTANVYLEMQEEHWNPNGGDDVEEVTGVSGSIDISDCFKKITLQLSAYNQPEARNVLYKLDTLIGTLSAAREFVAARAGELPRKRT